MRSNPAELRNRLASIAAHQAGYFSAAQARDAGYDYPQQSYQVNRGNWQRVEPRIFRLPHFPTGLNDDLVRASLWARHRGIVSHESAAAVHQLGELDPLKTHLTVPANFRPTHPSVVLHHGDVPNDQVEQREGFSVTTPARTLVDVSLSATDADQLDRALAEALDRKLTTPRLIRTAADHADPRAAVAIERALGRVRS